ncbi:MAG: 2-oxoisovalerate dehydrogenase [bacterium]
MSEIIFLVEDALEGGFSARALNYSIFTDGQTMQEVKDNIQDAVKCHFDNEELPKMVRLHFVRDEVYELV